MIQDKTQDDKMVLNLIAFRKTALSFVDTCFAKADNFRDAINDAFKFFINKRENKPAEMMGESSLRLFSIPEVISPLVLLQRSTSTRSYDLERSTIQRWSRS